MVGYQNSCALMIPAEITLAGKGMVGYQNGDGINIVSNATLAGKGMVGYQNGDGDAELPVVTLAGKGMVGYQNGMVGYQNRRRLRRLGRLWPTGPRRRSVRPRGKGS